MSDIITTNPVSIQLPTFKSAALAEQANAAARILNGLANSTRLAANDVARILCTIESGKLYEDDGFKTTAEFAEKCLNLKKSTVSTLIGAGKRFLQSDSKNPLPNQTAYNLYYLKDFSDDDIKEAVDAGEISNASTQADIKKWADEHAEKKSTADADSKPKIVPMFKVSFRFGNVIKTIEGDIPEADIMKHVLEATPVNSANVEFIKLTAVKADNDTVKRAVIIADDGRDIFGTILVYYKAVKPAKAAPKAKTVSFTDMSDDELLAELERRRAAKAVDPAKSAKAAARVAAAAKAAK